MTLLYASKEINRTQLTFESAERHFGREGD